MHYNINNPNDVRDLDEAMSAWQASNNPKALQWLPLPPKLSNDAKWQNGQWVEPTQEEINAIQRFSERLTLRQQWDALPSYIRGPYRPEFEAANALLDQNDDEAAISMIEHAEPKASFTEEEASVFETTKQTFKTAIENLTKI